VMGKNLSLGRLQLPTNTWSEIRFEWDLAAGTCLLYLNDRLASRLNVRHPTLNGLSYVRFRSTGDELDAEGFLVDKVEVSITDPYAPGCSVTDQFVHEQRYASKMVPLWSRSTK